MKIRIKIFEYVEQLDGFLVSDVYQGLADELGLTEWHPVVWIGRLFLMDNDCGEHWFDNWDLREQKRAEGSRLGYDVDTMLFLDPARFQDGKDGPCHSSDARKRFWTNVLQSLELDITLLFDEARSFQEALKNHTHVVPDNPDDLDEHILDLESRIAHIAARYERRE